MKTQRFRPIKALGLAVRKTGDYVRVTLSLLGRMLMGQVSIKHLGGPITIAEQAGNSAQIGILYFIQFMAIISVSLGVLNLLPIPVLDGGHIVFCLCEAVYRKPISKQVQEWAYRIGGFLLSIMIGLALYNDFSRVLGGSGL